MLKLKNPSVTTRVRLAVAIPLGALVLVVLALYPIVQGLRIGSPTYNTVRQMQSLQTDIGPSPLSLADATLLANEAYQTQFTVDATDASPVIKDKLRASLVSAKTLFQSKIAAWETTMAANSTLSPLLRDVKTSGSAVLTQIDVNLLPNLGPATATEARAAIESLNDLGRKHDVAIASLASGVNTQLIAREDAAKSSAQQRFIGLLGLSFLALAGAVLGSRRVTTSLLAPVEALTQQANRAAQHEIPAIVAAVNANAPGAVLMRPTPFPIAGSDEFGQLGVALNVMQDTAVSMAVDQANNRRGVSESLINLGRRNQGLLARTLAFITELEQNERNPETLSHLFRLDHLTTRMRRNAESLLVLAGSEPPRVWTESVPITDILRASLSEIESYSRVDLAGIDNTRVKGTTVSDLAHLIAELMENATNFSPPSSRVVVLGRNTADGYQLSIRDNGIGMTQGEMDDANRCLADSSSGDVTPSKVLGHYVVSKLAARHGIRVLLSQTIGSPGVTADVLVPLSVSDGGVGGGQYASHTDLASTSNASLPTEAATGWHTKAYPAASVQTPTPEVSQHAAAPEVNRDGLRVRVRGAHAPARDDFAHPPAAPLTSVLPTPTPTSTPVLPMRNRGTNWVEEPETVVIEADFRDPAQVRSALDGFQAAPLLPEPAAWLAPNINSTPPAPPPPMPLITQPQQVAVGVAVPSHVAPVGPAGLPLRQRGVSWAEQDNSTSDLTSGPSDPHAVRSALSSFQSMPHPPVATPAATDFPKDHS